MPIKRQEGEFDILYASTTEPTGTPSPPEEEPSNYTRIGFVADLGDELSNEAQSATDRESSTHESVIYGTQSSGFTLTANTQEEDSGGTTGEDAGQLILRDAAIAQTIVYFLINPEDGSGTIVPDLEGVYGSCIVESFNYTRNAGEFKQFEVTCTNREQPTYFTATAP